MTKPTAKPGRQPALEPYIAKLREWVRQRDKPAKFESRTTISIDGQNLVVDAWEQEQLELYLAGDAPENPAAHLVSHVVALALKTCVDVRRLKGHTERASASLYLRQAELMMDAAIGAALLRQMQQEVDRLVMVGELERAKLLSSSTNKLARAIPRAKRSVSESERQRTGPAPAPSLNRPARAPAVRGAQQPTLLEELAERPIQARWSAKKRRRRRKRGEPLTLPSRTEMLTLLLGVTGVLWIGFVLLPSLIDDRANPVLRDDLPRAELIASIEALPPSLYVSVDPEVWTQLSDVEKYDLVDQVAGSVTVRGYDGVLVRTTVGRPVAQWLRERATMLIVRTEDAPAEPEPEPEP